MPITIAMPLLGRRSRGGRRRAPSAAKPARTHPANRSKRTATARGRSGLSLGRAPPESRRVHGSQSGSLFSGAESRFDSEMRRMQAKRQMGLFYPTPSASVVVQRGPQHRSSVSSENPRRAIVRAAREAAAELAAASRSARSASGSSRGDRRRPPSRGHALAFEVGADPLVAVAPGGQLLGPRAREPRVVDVAGTLQRVERVVPARPRTRLHASSLARRDSRGVIAPGERPNGAVDGALAPQATGAASPTVGTASPDSLASTTASSAFGTAPRPRPRPPPPSSSRPSPGRPARRPAAAGRRRSGRRLAAPGSAGGSPCVTSGCSRRNAVAFWRPWPRRSSSKLKYEPDFWTTFRSSPASSTDALPGDPHARRGCRTRRA